MLETRQELSLEKRKLDRCDLCGSSNLVHWDHARGNSLDQCADCGLVFTNPVFVDYDKKDREIYDRGYFVQASRNTQKLKDARQVSYRAELAELDRQVSQPEDGARLRILDVGCGVGAFLEVFPEDKWDRHGCDISSFAVEEAAKLGVTTYHGELEKLDFGDLLFDVVYFRASLHHTRSPKQCLDAARKLLKPGGCLVIAMSNCRDGLCGKLFGARVKSYEQGHNYLFDEKSLRRYLRDAGFSVAHKVVPYFGTGYESLSDVTDLPGRYAQLLYRRHVTGDDRFEDKPDFASPTFYGNYISLYAKAV